MFRSQWKHRACAWRGIGLAIGLAFVAAIANAAAAQNSPASATPTLLILGDSISAEYGLPRDTGWVKLLRDRLESEHREYNVVNASISGETTSGGAERLPGLIARLAPKIVVIELGGNDGLRGLSLSATESNFRRMIEASQAAHSRVLLVGMQLPPNYGPDFTERFARLYPKLAGEYHTALVPFFFAGFAENLALFQADRIHPTQSAQPRLLENVWPHLAPLLG